MLGTIDNKEKNYIYTGKGFAMQTYSSAHSAVPASIPTDTVLILPCRAGSWECYDSRGNSVIVQTHSLASDQFRQMIGFFRTVRLDHQYAPTIREGMLRVGCAIPEKLAHFLRLRDEASDVPRRRCAIPRHASAATSAA